ncbi:hypothetical protein CYLTODRAFT_492471 [Cylindrobasidium torrendii FP15055 ss-10]|uniref:Uncharacterized protein n=1 Tax=Cylindrobasidium torrendii FP15055 ss-10 TaxID=1314674 RepID=A0A0D7B4W6_9AGAR|nr:hypothetical protein CYLTODRAFT_492471 [Cylindrobasidium torrendii FP15055 ss-10]
MSYVSSAFLAELPFAFQLATGLSLCLILLGCFKCSRFARRERHLASRHGGVHRDWPAALLVRNLCISPTVSSIAEARAVLAAPGPWHRQYFDQNAFAPDARHDAFFQRINAALDNVLEPFKQELAENLRAKLYHQLPRVFLEGDVPFDVPLAQIIGAAYIAADLTSRLQELGKEIAQRWTPRKMETQRVYDPEVFEKWVKNVLDKRLKEMLTMMDQDGHPDWSQGAEPLQSQDREPEDSEEPSL